MNSILLLLLLRSLRGRVVSWAKLLRHPRYLVAAAAGAAYFGWLLRPLFRSDSGAAINVLYHMPDELAVGLQLVAAAALFFAMSVSWMVMRGLPGVRLTQVERQLLLPAPLPRRRLVEYVLLKVQPGFLAAAVIVGLMSLRYGLRVAGARVLAVWLVVTVFDLNGRACALCRNHLQTLPQRRAWWYRGALIVVIVALWALVVTAVMATRQQLWDAATGAAGPMQALTAAATVLARSDVAVVLRIILTPCRWLVAPLLPPASGLQLSSWLLPVLLLVAHWLWVTRSRAWFLEEAGVVRRHIAAQPLRRRPGIRLREHGSPELAIAWKNLLSITRRPPWQVLLLLPGVGLITATLTAVSASRTEIMTAVCLLPAYILVVMLPLLAGLIFRDDVRQDLLFFPALRQAPLPGWRLLAGEILTPTVLATVTSAFGLVAVLGWDAGGRLAGLSSVSSRPMGLPFGWGDAVVATLGLAPAIVGVTALSVAVQNCIAVLVPSWVPLGRLKDASQSVMTGQYLLLSMAHVVVMALALLIPAGLAAALVAILSLAGVSPNPWYVPLLALGAAVPLVGEASALVWFAGRLWDRIDPPHELLTRS